MAEKTALGGLFKSGEPEKKPREDIEKLKKPAVAYTLSYDSFQEGLEAIYFWFVDFLKGKPPTSGVGYEVSKTEELFEASLGSAFHSDLGIKATRMQDQAIKMMGTINTVVRSIINLIYDLREFDIRLEIYKDFKSADAVKKNAAELALKQVWLDNVDIKKGRGAVHAMTQQLQFVTLRDAFLFAKDVKDVDKIDLNERVKRILRARLEEYEKWRGISENELRKRFNIERSYLKSQVSALKIYTKWSKPYFLAAKRLGLHDFSSPNIITIFNTLETELKLFGKKKLDVKELIYQGEFPEIKPGQDYYSCIEVTFKFRSIPHTAGSTQAGTRYVQGGRVEIAINGFALGDADLKKLEEKEIDDELRFVEEMTETSLVEIADDLKKYVEEEEEEPEESKKTFLRKLLGKTKDDSTKKAIERHLREIEKKKDVYGVNPLKALFSGFKEILKPIVHVRKSIGGFTKGLSYADHLVKSNAEGIAVADSFIVYDTYKKDHRMLSW